MTSTKIPVIIWIYHLDIWNKFLTLLISSKDLIYPVIGLCNDNDNKHIVKSIQNNFNEYIIEYYDNFGKDIGPFLQQIQNIENEFFIKIHTKKDDNWRDSLIYDLLEKDLLINNIKTISQKEIMMPWNNLEPNDIGLISTRNYIVSNHEFTNSNHIKQICDILNIDYDKLKFGRYVSGTMFMGRTYIFKKYFNEENTNKILNLIKAETGDIKDHLSGKYTHSLERIFGYIITNENLRITSPIFHF